MQGLAVKLAALTAAVGALFFALTTAASAATPGSFTTLTASSATTLKSTLTVTGATTLNSTLAVTGLITAKGGLTVAAGKATSLGGALTVTGATTLKSTAAVTGLLSANGGLTVATGKTLTIAGTGKLSVGGTSALHATTVTGTLTSSGLITANGGLKVVGALTLPSHSVADTALSTNVALRNAANTFSGTNTFSGAMTVSSIGQAVGAFSVNSAGDINARGGFFADATGFGNGSFAADPMGNVSVAGLPNGTYLVDQNGNVTANGFSAGYVNALGTWAGYNPSFTVTGGHDNVPGNTHVYGDLTVDGGITYTSQTFNVTAAGITSTGLLSAEDLSVSGSVSLPAASIADSALSSNVALLDAAGNAFGGNLSVGGDLTVSGAVNLPAGSIADSALSANVPLLDAASNDFTGDLTVGGGLTVSGAVDLPSGSISDTALSANVPLLDAATNSFTGNLAVAGSLSAGSLSVSGPTISHMASAPNSYDMSGGSQNLTTDDLLTTGLAVIQANGASQTNALVTPTAAAIVAAMPAGTAVGDTFHFTLVNADTGTNQVVTGGAGVTIAGSSYVRYATEYTFTCRATNVTGGAEAVTCY